MQILSLTCIICLVMLSKPVILSFCHDLTYHTALRKVLFSLQPREAFANGKSDDEPHPHIPIFVCCCLLSGGGGVKEPRPHDMYPDTYMAPILWSELFSPCICCYGFWCIYFVCVQLKAG